MGYRTCEGQAQGIERLHDRLHRSYSDDTCRVILRSWNDPIAPLVERIKVWSPTFGAPEIVLLGHSYGGYSCVLTARLLEQAGLKVAYLALIDAVWRWPTRMTVLSLLPYPKIKIPLSVGRLVAWRQDVSYPRGHELVIPPGVSYEIIPAHVEHVLIDSDPQILDRIEHDIGSVLDEE